MHGIYGMIYAIFLPPKIGFSDTSLWFYFQKSLKIFERRKFDLRQAGMVELIHRGAYFWFLHWSISTWCYSFWRYDWYWCIYCWYLCLRYSVVNPILFFVSLSDVFYCFYCLCFWCKWLCWCIWSIWC